MHHLSSAVAVFKLSLVVSMLASFVSLIFRQIFRAHEERILNSAEFEKYRRRMVVSDSADVNHESMYGSVRSEVDQIWRNLPVRGRSRGYLENPVSRAAFSWSYQNKIDQNVFFEQIIEGTKETDIGDMAKLFHLGYFWTGKGQQIPLDEGVKRVSKLLSEKSVLKSRVIQGVDVVVGLGIFGDSQSRNKSGLSAKTFGYNVAIVAIKSGEYVANLLLMVAPRGGWGVYWYLSSLFVGRKMRGKLMRG